MSLTKNQITKCHTCPISFLAGLYIYIHIYMYGGDSVCFICFISIFGSAQKIVPDFTSGAKVTVQTREMPRSCRFVSFGDGWCSSEWFHRL